MQNDEREFNAAVRLGGLYDSRVGSASGGSDGDSDTALAASIRIGWQPFSQGAFGFRLGYSGYADFHQDFARYDVIVNSVSLEPRYTVQQVTYGLPLSLDMATQDGEADYNRYTVSPTAIYLFPDATRAAAVYGAASRIDDRDRSREDEDGVALGAGCAYVMLFKKSHLRLSVDYQHTTYDAPVSAYPPLATSMEKRKDNSWAAGIEMQFLLGDHLGLFANYACIHSRSNVEIYDYARHLLEAGVVIEY